MIFADLPLARRLEQVSALNHSQYARVQEGLHPGSTAALAPPGGGSVVFVGADSPITRAGGMGMSGPVPAAELDEVEAFYRSRGLPVTLDICPLADRSLLDLISQRGYRLRAFLNRLVLPLAPGAAPTPAAPAAPPSGTGLTVRAIRPGEERLWCVTVAQGFMGRDDIHPDALAIPEPTAHNPLGACFLAFLGDEPVGAGALTMRDGVGSLFSTSVRPAYRGRGVQTALIVARLAHAASAGCDLAAVQASPGSGSQRNLERFGFRLAYSAASFFLP